MTTCDILKNRGAKKKKDIIILDFSKVIVDGEHASIARVKSGVPQGAALGPILFLFN